LRCADAAIILIDRRNHRIFQPLLYQVAIAFSRRPRPCARSCWLTMRSGRAYPPIGASREKTTFDPALASYGNGVGSITDLNVLSTQLLQAKNASTDVYSTALAAAASLALATG
jgi:hypothetical protein